MRTEEFISATIRRIQSGDTLAKEKLPLGVKADGELLFSHERADKKVCAIHHTAITGNGATEYIKRLICVLSTLYKKGEAQFLILSPKSEYGELLRLQNADITAPFISSLEQLNQAKETYKTLLSFAERNPKAPKLFLVLDGLETLTENETGDLASYREFLELSARKKAEVITGANLIKSIFSGFPGAFVGVGNCLVTTGFGAQADATFVAPDSSMSLPTAITVPDTPSVPETVLFLNAFKA